MTSDEDTVEIPVGERFTEHFFARPTPRIPLTFGAQSHIGNVRKTNEDHYAITRRARTNELLLSNLPESSCPPLVEEAHMLVVADGVGGAAFGELASQLVLEIAWELGSQATSWVMKLADVNAQQIRERVNAYVERMEARLREVRRHNPELAGMATTWTSAYVMGSDVVVVNIGDSRAYLFRDGECRQITRDHTLAKVMEQKGLEPPPTWRLQNLLVNCLGVERKSQAVPELHQVSLKPGDRLLLCTDGLTESLDDEIIRGSLASYSDPQVACEELVRQALEASGRDNITVLVAAVGAEEKE